MLTFATSWHLMATMNNLKSQLASIHFVRGTSYLTEVLIACQRLANRWRKKNEPLVSWCINVTEKTEFEN
ncbi:hypothetical protein OUZ56_022963 [Daphnia magna]|uniref:Uncharacterized protein n=1 Tax=Daphnia magna TaxID=35525 RepID=A0ABR0AXZ1_9CRUS|nr:hypothetical protein OUZ56_022963 [Daphnia magna]